MISNRNIALLGFLACIEIALFYSQFADQLAPYYPTNFDQVSYLVQSYLLVGAFFKDGWLGLLSFFGTAPQGATFPIQGALLALIGGVHRVAMTSINLVYFLGVQVVVFWTVSRKTGSMHVAWFAIALILALGATFNFAGGIYDYRMDFSAMCLYGIWVCTLLNTDLFRSRRWSLAAGLIGTLLVSMRFVALTYVGTTLLVLFLVLILRKWRAGGSWAPVVNCFLSGTLILALVTPVLYYARDAIFAYYVVGHVTGDEPAIRAAEAGISSTLDNLLYYPRNILSAQLGAPFIYIAAVFLFGCLLLGRKKLMPIRPFSSDVCVLFTSIIVPVFIFTLDYSKSPVVANTVAIPSVLLLAFLANTTVSRSTGSVLASLAVLVAMMTYISNATAPQHSLAPADLRSISQLNNSISDYIETYDVQSPQIAVDRVEAFISALLIDLYYLERSDPRGPFQIRNAQQSMGGIFAISKEEALKSIDESDIVVLTSQFKGRDYPYPLNASMKEIWPELDAFARENLFEIASQTIGGIPYTVFAKGSIKLTGLSGEWITDEGLTVSVDRKFLTKKPFIVLEGLSHDEWLGSPPLVQAGLVGGGSLPVSYKSSEGRFNLTIDARSLPNGGETANIFVKFDRFFVPKEIGVNQDERKLVVQLLNQRLSARPHEL